MMSIPVQSSVYGSNYNVYLIEHSWYMCKKSCRIRVNSSVDYVLYQLYQQAEFARIRLFVERKYADLQSGTKQLIKQTNKPCVKNLFWCVTNFLICCVGNSFISFINNMSTTSIDCKGLLKIVCVLFILNCSNYYNFLVKRVCAWN